MSVGTLRIISISVNIVCFLFCTLIGALYSFKRKIKTKENSVYDALIICNIVCLVLEFIFYLTSYSSGNDAVATFTEKLYFAANSIWMFIHFIYILIISKTDTSSNYSLKKKKSIVLSTILLIAIIVFVLPVENIYDNGYLVGSKGAATIFVFLLCFGLTLVDLILVLKNKKNIKKNKLAPLFIFIILILIELFLNAIGFKLLLMTLPMTLVCFLMYHTIENPDVRMIEKLNIAKDQAEKANRAKTEFLSSMSHEIRTPLNAIVGFSECLMDNPKLDMEAKDHAKDIVEASNNLLEIVNGILDISKIEANKMEIVPKEYNPREVFNGLSKLVIPRISNKPIEFKLIMAEDIPGVLKGDVNKVKQIVLNLLTNAAKYTEKGEIVFNVNCINRLDINKCSLNISVRDTGRGIKKEDINKLFKKFERLDEDKNTTTEGTGLGLAITKSLAEMMGGRVNVQSDYGEGSVFRVFLEQDIVTMEIPEDGTEEIEIDYTKFKDKRILIVDDSKINLKVANNILKPYNFKIVNALSGFEALDIMETGTFDLILMDIMMPKMNGVETLRRLKEIPGFNIPVVALTADAIEGQDEKYMQAGFDDYLSKPIDRYLLDKTLNKFLGGQNEE